MYLQFVPKSHLFFTAGKDRKVKQWDADRFEHIQTLEVTCCFALSGWKQVGSAAFSLSVWGLFSLQGHHQEVWCLAVSPNGDYVVSSSHDKSLRLWERTREPLVLEDEREMVRTPGHKCAGGGPTRFPDGSSLPGGVTPQLVQVPGPPGAVPTALAISAARQGQMPPQLHLKQQPLVSFPSHFPRRPCLLFPVNFCLSLGSKGKQNTRRVWPKKTSQR